MLNENSTDPIKPRSISLNLEGAASGGYGYNCCPPVVDPYTFLALIGGIALATYFLRVLIVTTTVSRNSSGHFRGAYFCNYFL